MKVEIDSYDLRSLLDAATAWYAMHQTHRDAERIKQAILRVGADANFIASLGR